MILIVTGGRRYNEHQIVWHVLDAIHGETPISELGTGGQTGADTHADEWAVARGVRRQRFIVSQEDWNTIGPSAGPKRNKRMHDTMQPDLVLAFPGGPGTESMINIAKKAGTPVIHSHEILKLV